MQLHEVAYLGDDLRRLVVGCRLVVVGRWYVGKVLFTTTTHYYSTSLLLLLLLYY